VEAAMSYAVVHPEGAKKAVLVKIVKQGGSKMIGVRPDHTMYTDKQSVEFRGKDVIVHLGDKPPVGSVYGTWVEPVEKRRTAKGWGDVYWYTQSDDTVVERVHKALRVALKRLAERGLDGWKNESFLTEVRNPKGRNLGSYTYKSNAADKLVLRDVAGQGLREYVKVIAHEGGHGIWHRILSPEERAEFIDLYEQFIAVKTVSVAEVKDIVKSIRQIESIRAHLKESEPDEQAATNIYLGWLSKVHKMSPRAVQDLVAAGKKIPVPDTHLHRSEVSTPITLYSKSSADELFCEALGSDVVGDLADKRIKKMIRALSR
jgi:hypothetical protein